MKATPSHPKGTPFELTRSAVLGLVLIVGLGVALVTLNLGGPLGRLSYDLPFFFQDQATPAEVVLVHINADTRRVLGLKGDGRIPRARHAELLERLTRDGARIVYYDILFSDAGPNAEDDRRFADAIRGHGRVVLGAAYRKSIADAGTAVETVEEPVPIFRDAAQAWGLAAFSRVDADYVVRSLPSPLADFPDVNRIVAGLAGSRALNLLQEREAYWLRYYGPPGAIPSVTFHQALNENGVPPGFFKGKIVCIGGQDTARDLIFGVDQFANPYSRWEDLFSDGLEVQATILLNLLRGDWLARPAALAEGALVALLGLVAWLLFYSMPPLRGTLVVVLAALVIGIVSIWLHLHRNLWWNWLVPAAVQFPAALVWSVTTRYASEARKRARLREAFSLYLSPQMADRVARQEFDLKPGGKLTEATVLFTDCKGFTAMSEELRDPKIISDTLIAYFTETSKHVLENDGTIIKYIGDAVFACWNAPIADAAHAAKAVRAAWGIAQASKQVVLGRVLTTRVGVATGEVLAGNLGSPYRFDYTCTGDPVNFASRLEGLNKYLGTGVLVAESTRLGLGDLFVLRGLGSFVVAGKTEPIAIHEVLAPVEAKPADLAWLETWQAAMKALRAGDFTGAQKLLRETIWQRGGKDGPGEFYLQHIAELEKKGQLDYWAGVVHLDAK